MVVDDSKIEKMLSKDESEVRRLIYMFEDGKGVPIFLDLPDFIEFAERVDKTIKLINKSKNPRLIILETWLIVDYSIRHILRHGLEIDKFCDNDFDLLPESFRYCAELLQRFTKNQKRKKPNPAKLGIHLPPDFAKIIAEDKKFSIEYSKKEQEYYRKVGGTLTPTSMRSDSRLRNVNEGWLRAVGQLDDAWFRKARKLNDVRNSAAHSFEESAIYRELGINGSNKLKKLKSRCTALLKELVGLK